MSACGPPSSAPRTVAGSSDVTSSRRPEGRRAESLRTPPALTNSRVSGWRREAAEQQGGTAGSPGAPPRRNSLVFGIEAVNKPLSMTVSNASV